MRRLTTGFELSKGTTTADLLIADATSESTNYDVAPSTTQKRSGAYALRVQRSTGFSGAGCYAEFLFGNSSSIHQPADPGGVGPNRFLIEGSATNQYVYVRGYIRFAVLSGATAARLNLVYLYDNSGNIRTGLGMRESTRGKNANLDHRWNTFSWTSSG